MLFERLPKYEGYLVTERKKSAYARKLRKELASYPLIDFHVASEQKSMDDEFNHRVCRAEKTDQARRDDVAQLWRKARKLYYSLPLDVRLLVKNKWLHWWGGRTAFYFWYVVEEYSGERKKRLDMLERKQQQFNNLGEVQIGF